MCAWGVPVRPAAPSSHGQAAPPPSALSFCQHVAACVLGRDVGEEVDEGPQAVSPRDFVDRQDVLTLEEYEAKAAATKA